MWNVVEQQPGNGYDPEILHTAGLGYPPESGVLGVEYQRHERLEAARLVLERAKLKEVVDPFFVGLHVAVEHRAVALEAKAVCDPVDLNPALPGALVPANYLAHTGGENLSPTAWHGIHPRIHETLDYLAR